MKIASSLYINRLYVNVLTSPDGDRWEKMAFQLLLEFFFLLSTKIFF